MYYDSYYPNPLYISRMRPPKLEHINPALLDRPPASPIAPSLLDASINHISEDINFFNQDDMPLFKRLLASVQLLGEMEWALLAVITEIQNGALPSNPQDLKDIIRFFMINAPIINRFPTLYRLLRNTLYDINWKLRYGLI
ncbi:MAG: hypothetical protein RLZ12_358 [Bacillota bacterium]|jgi:hypothetical protein